MGNEDLLGKEFRNFINENRKAKNQTMKKVTNSDMGEGVLNVAFSLWRHFEWPLTFYTPLLHTTLMVEYFIFSEDIQVFFKRCKFKKHEAQNAKTLTNI